MRRPASATARRNPARITYQRTATPLTSRSLDGIAALVAGYALVDPGLALLPDSRPAHPVDRAPAEAANAYAGVGYVPAPS